MSGYTALCDRVDTVKVAKVSLGYDKEVHWCIIYVLKTGAELFGGQPTEHTVGLDLSDDDNSEVAPGGLRQRRAKEPKPSRKTTQPDTPLPCLLPFLRIHDGFGCLMSTKHLPLVLESPHDTIHGSCYYVYPQKGLTSVLGVPNLMKFARVDKQCFVCIDLRQDVPGVVYVERTGDTIEDDEEPLTFIADTVSNICGQRVVPPPYEGGPSAYANMGGITVGTM
eukprot:TRINITY_DN3267_c0_g1_i1.p1 TRINITY_DN3267_c0_g1~~TRINITY_DN3267_c0_g1_i1.p1  ORF type:complete len:223 (-),score=27.66 TRINITY_DN3267_c0_g1_i1:153-821(-)